MGEWISGQKVLNDNNISRPDFFNIVTGKDLQPYYQSSRRKPSPEFLEILAELEELNKQLPILKRSIKKSIDPNDFRQMRAKFEQEREGKDDKTELQYTKTRIKEIKSELPHPNPYSWKDYRLPSSEEEADEVINDLINSYFRTADVDSLLKVESSENNSDKKLVNDQTTDGQDGAFTLDGNMWKIKFRGKGTSLYNRERIRYIVHLLEYPDRDFYARELYRLVKGQPNEVNIDYNTMSEDQLEKEGLSLTELNIESLSKKEKDRLENIAHDIWEQLREAENKGDQNKIKKANNAWSETKKHLDYRYGIQIIELSKGLKFLKRHRLIKEDENARITVKQQINNAIKEIEEYIPSLSKYLKTHIKTGGTCKYSPDPDKPIKWKIQWSK